MDRDATRNILLNWDKLSEGDISIFYAALKKSDEARVLTMQGSPHCTMWENLVILGWAKEVDLRLPPPGKAFEITPEGRSILPSFVRHYDLKPGTFYRDKIGT